VIDLVEIPNNKFQKTNKSQHAAQVPALRVTEIQNHKQKNNRFASGPEGTGLEFEICLRFGA